MKIAYFSPLLPSRTGIAEYSVRLLRELSRPGLKFDLFTSHVKVDEQLASRFTILDYVRHPGVLETVPEYDLAVYHVGNNLEFHEHIYGAALRYPGLVVLHDYVLHNLLVSIFLGKRKDRAAYYRELEYCYGADGKRIGDEAFVPPRKRIWELDEVIDHPLNDRLVRTSRGIVVHSRFVEGRLRRKHPEVWLRRIESFVMTHAPTGNVARTRVDLGVPKEALLLGSFGFMTRVKRIPSVLAALAVVRERFDVHYLLVGELIDPKIEQTIEQLDIGSRVHMTGYVDESRYMNLIQACDICVNLRLPTMGETSAVLCQCLSLAKPCIVTDVAWYSELPDDCVKKVKADAQEVSKLVAAVEEFAARPGLRHSTGEKGRSYVVERHDNRKIADAYLQACEDLTG